MNWTIHKFVEVDQVDNSSDITVGFGYKTHGTAPFRDTVDLLQNAKFYKVVNLGLGLVLIRIGRLPRRVDVQGFDWNIL